MSKEMYDFIVSNKDKVNYDLKKGIVITKKGTNGTICSTTGYLKFKLNKRLITVHQFLSVIYFGEKCIGLQVNHIDSDKTNNKKENLEVVTQLENLKHQWDNGDKVMPDVKGSKHGNSKLKESDVLDIRKMYEQGKKIFEISRNYEVSQGCISDIVNKRTWKHI